MFVRGTSIALIVAMSICQSACTIRTTHRLEQEELTWTGTPSNNEIDKRAVICSAVLGSGEVIQFDERGGAYVQRDHIILGWSKDGRRVMIDIDEVESVNAKRDLAGFDLLRAIALTTGEIVEFDEKGGCIDVWAKAVLLG